MLFTRTFRPNYITCLSLKIALFCLAIRNIAFQGIACRRLASRRNSVSLYTREWNSRRQLDDYSGVFNWNRRAIGEDVNLRGFRFHRGPSVEFRAGRVGSRTKTISVWLIRWQNTSVGISAIYAAGSDGWGKGARDADHVWTVARLFYVWTSFLPWYKVFSVIATHNFTSVLLFREQKVDCRFVGCWARFVVGKIKQLFYSWKK